MKGRTPGHDFRTENFKKFKKKKYKHLILSPEGLKGNMIQKGVGSAKEQESDNMVMNDSSEEEWEVAHETWISSI